MMTQTSISNAWNALSAFKFCTLLTIPSPFNPSFTFRVPQDKVPTQRVAHTLQLSAYTPRHSLPGTYGVLCTHWPGYPFYLPFPNSPSLSARQLYLLREEQSYWPLGHWAVLEQFFFPYFGNVAGDFLRGSMGKEVFQLKGRKNWVVMGAKTIQTGEPEPG